MNTGLNIDIEEMVEIEGQTLWLASTLMPLRDHAGRSLRSTVTTGSMGAESLA